MGSETTKNISESINTEFKIPAATSEHTVEELHSCADLHTTDATAHNN